jgi:hypothetical protein
MKTLGELLTVKVDKYPVQLVTVTLFVIKSELWVVAPRSPWSLAPMFLIIVWSFSHRVESIIKLKKPDSVSVLVEFSISDLEIKTVELIIMNPFVTKAAVLPPK